MARPGRNYKNPTFLFANVTPASGSIALGIAIESDNPLPLTIVTDQTTRGQTLIAHGARQRSRRLLTAPQPAPFIMSPGANLGGAYVNYAEETDTGLALVLAGDKFIPLGLATQETDTAFALTETKTRTLGFAIETDVGIHIDSTTGHVFLFPHETDTVFALIKTKTVGLGLALETDTALGIELPIAYLGFAEELDTALPLTIILQSRTFTPRSRLENPPILPDTRGAARHLFRHYRTRPAGINVYMYRAGTVSAAAFGRVTEEDPTATYNSDGVPISNGWEDIELVFYGGHDGVDVTAAQAALLESQGYTVD